MFVRLSVKIKLPMDAFEFLLQSKFWFEHDRNLLLPRLLVFEKEKKKLRTLCVCFTLSGSTTLKIHRLLRRQGKTSVP